LPPFWIFPSMHPFAMISLSLAISFLIASILARLVE
jgi:hypothetical protein